MMDIIKQVIDGVANLIDLEIRPHRDDVLVVAKCDFENGLVPIMKICQFRDGERYDMVKEIHQLGTLSHGEAMYFPVSAFRQFDEYDD